MSSVGIEEDWETGSTFVVAGLKGDSGKVEVIDRAFQSRHPWLLMFVPDEKGLEVMTLQHSGLSSRGFATHQLSV